MQFDCPVCQASYNVPEDRLSQTVNRAVCKKCGVTMLINKETGEIKSQAAPDEQPSRSLIKDTRMSEGLPSVLSMSARDAGQRDYLAITVVALALFALIAAGFYFVLYISKSFDSGSIKSVTRFLDDFTDFGKFFGREAAKKKGSPSRQARKAEKYIRRGYQYYQQKSYKKAFVEYSKAIEIDPSNSEAYFWRARSSLKTEQYDKAIADLKEAVKFDPSYSKAFDNLGWLYMKRGEYDKSIRYLDNSIRLKPDNGWAYYTRGHIYIKKGELQKGLIDANKACKMGYKEGCKIYQEYKK